MWGWEVRPGQAWVTERGASSSRMKNSALFQSQAITFIFIQTPEDNMVKEMRAKLQPYAHKPGRIQQKPTRLAAQLRVLFFPLSFPSSRVQPHSYGGVCPSKEEDKGQEQRKDARSSLLAFLSIRSLPWETSLWRRGQTAGQSVIRTHLVSGGNARPQALSLAWHSYLIPSLESPLKVGIIIPHLQKRKRSQARGPVQTTGFLNGRVGNWHQSSLLPNPAMIRSRGQGLPPQSPCPGQARADVLSPGLASLCGSVGCCDPVSEGCHASCRGAASSSESRAQRLSIWAGLTPHQRCEHAWVLGWNELL